jgi:hypothetical protein
VNAASGPVSSSVVQKEAPVLPMKPVTQIIIENESINEELDNFLKNKNVDELKLLLSEEAKSNELYFNLATVNKQHKKLQDYLEVLRRKSLEVFDMRSLLEESIKSYERLKTEYSSVKRTIEQEVVNLEKFKSDYIEKSGIKSLLNSKMSKADIQAQVFRKNLKQALKDKTKNVAKDKIPVAEIDKCVEDFIKDYRKCITEYNYCNVLLESLSK